MGWPRRSLVVIAIGLLFAASCSDAEDNGQVQSTPSAETTSTPSTERDPTTEPGTDTTPTSFPQPPIPEPFELEDVNLMRCLDAECSQIQKVKLDKQEMLPPGGNPGGVREVWIQDILVRPDGRPLVLAEWFTPHRLDSGWDDEFAIYSCVDVDCSAVTTQVVLEGANGWSGVVLPDGSLAISYQTGQQVLCEIPGECSDPDRNDLSSLELLICPDPDECSITGGSGRIVVLDREGMTGLFGGHILAGADGAPMVLYEREVGDQVTEVRLARCSDAQCSGVSVSVVVEPEAAGLAPDGAVALPDGAPAFVQDRRFADRRETRVLACDNPACRTVVVSAGFELGSDLGGAAAWGLATDGDGRLVIFTSGSLFDDDMWVGYTFSVVSCVDRACEVPKRSGVLAEHRAPGWGVPRGSPVGVLPDGRPMFTYNIGAAEMGEDSFTAYTVCDDPECSSATTLRLDDPDLVVAGWDPATASGLMMFPLNTPLS